MPTLEAIRAALAAFVAGGASETEQRLVVDALRAGRLMLPEGERSVAVGGRADEATIVTGDGNVVLALDAAAAQAVRALLGPPVPRQLPSDLPDFTGREREIAALERALGGDGGRAAITAIGGMGGVGKTALAVHVAHRLAARYPDGQIVVDLKGTTEPLSPAAAMGQVIVALDPVRKLPDDAAELVGLYRSLLGGRRLLLLFDNAADAAQVREMLPAPPCVVIVTSRRAVVLPGLQRVPLDVLAPEEADALLLGIIGEGRASAEERVRLAERCGRLPLALRVAGTFLVSYPDWGVAEYLTELANERERLRRLRLEDDALLDVAAALGLSRRQLACDRPELVERWRMLAVFAAGFDRQAAAAVWAVAPAEARDGLSLLLERSMLLFDAAKQRYRLHDLMRDLALGAAEPLSWEEERRLEEARDRHSAHYQRLLAEANGLFEQGGDAGLAWRDQERANIEAGERWRLGQPADDEAVARRGNAYVAAGSAVLSLPNERLVISPTAYEARLYNIDDTDDSYLESLLTGPESHGLITVRAVRRLLQLYRFPDEERVVLEHASNEPLVSLRRRAVEPGTERSVVEHFVAQSPAALTRLQKLTGHSAFFIGSISLMCLVDKDKAWQREWLPALRPFVVNLSVLIDVNPVNQLLAWGSQNKFDVFYGMINVSEKDTRHAVYVLYPDTGEDVVYIIPCSAIFATTLTYRIRTMPNAARLREDKRFVEEKQKRLTYTVSHLFLEEPWFDLPDTDAEIEPVPATGGGGMPFGRNGRREGSWQEARPPEGAAPQVRSARAKGDGPRR